MPETPETQSRQKGITAHLQTTILLRAQVKAHGISFAPHITRNAPLRKASVTSFSVHKAALEQQQQKRDLQMNELNCHVQNLSSKSVLVRKRPCVEHTCRGLQTCHTQPAKSLPLVSNGPKAYHKYHSGKGCVENAAVDSSGEAGSIAQLVEKGGEEGKAGKYLPSV